MSITWLETWLENRDSWFDLVAYCYSDICSRGLDVPQFYTCFENEIHREGSVLDDIINRVSEVVMGDCNSISNGREKALNKIRYYLNIASKHHATSTLSKDSISCLVMIAGIDKAYSNLDISADAVDIGPLNNKKRDKVGVYYKAEDSRIKNILSVYGIKPSPESRLSERLQVFDLARRIDPYPLPVIIHPTSHTVNLKKDANDINLRIGVASCTISPLFSKEDQNCIVYKCNRGGALSFEYPHGYEERYEEIVGRSLQKAIDNDCDIVVFPELIMPQGFIEKLQSVSQHL